MKYLVAFSSRQGGAPADIEVAEKRSMDVFSKWTAPEGVTFHQFVARLDARGGYAVVESDDPMLVAEGPAKFAPWFDFEVTPVLDMAEAMTIAQAAIDFRDAVS